MDGMAASATFATLAPEDQYLVRRIAARDHVDIETLALLPPHALDLLLPGARAAYLDRNRIVSERRARRGLDPNSQEYKDEAAQARAILAEVDKDGADNAA